MRNILPDPHRPQLDVYKRQVLQNRQIPMRLRMWKILAAASDFQRCVDRNQLFKWEEIRERHKASGYGEAFTSKVQKLSLIHISSVLCSGPAMNKILDR